MGVAGRSARRSDRGQRRLSQILDVAKAAFLTRSYSEVKVEEIAAEAGVSKAAVYLYFSSKVEIYGSILERDMHRLGEALRRAYRPEADIEANLLAFGRAYLSFFRTHSEYFGKLSFYRLPGREAHLPPEIAEQVSAAFVQAMRAVEDALRQAAEQGTILAEDAWRSTAALWSMWLGASYLAILEPSGRHGSELQEIVDTGTRRFLHGLARR